MLITNFFSIFNNSIYVVCLTKKESTVWSTKPSFPSRLRGIEPGANKRNVEEYTAKSNALKGVTKEN
jgi:hypothetical protein